jgi:3-oxoacyl-[acyl-carrier-protein] synthase-3
MPFLSFDKIGITALGAAVPKQVIDYDSMRCLYSDADVNEVMNKTGVYERRFADEFTCASDLCYAAAEQVIADNDIDRTQIDLIIFVSQTPDYRMPATSVLLQHRLHLPVHTMAFDINLGCSGFIYGMSVVFSLMHNKGIRKALLLNGETRSKAYSLKDRRTAFLFGDAGVAALIERNDAFGPSFFSLNSDGSGEDLIKIPAGGYRNPSSIDSLKEKVVDEFGNVRNDEQGYMNGGDVFNFVIKNIPNDIRKILAYAGKEKDSPDYYIFHQANKFINDYLVRRMNLDTQKVPSTISKFGNTSSVSVPLTIVSEFTTEKIREKELLLSAFGVGMTWGSAYIHQPFLSISPIVEV